MKYSKKSQYLNEYKLDENGKYVYRGKYFSIDGNTNEIKSTYIRVWVYFSVIFAAIIGSGCINAAGMNNSFYVIIPYIAEVVLLFAYGLSFFKLFAKGYRVKEYNYSVSFKKLSPASMGIAVTAAISFICSLVFIIINGFDNQIIGCILYLLLKIFVICSAFVNSRYVGSLKWMEI